MTCPSVFLTTEVGLSLCCLGLICGETSEAPRQLGNETGRGLASNITGRQECNCSQCWGGDCEGRWRGWRLQVLATVQSAHLEVRHDVGEMQLNKTREEKKSSIRHGIQNTMQGAPDPHQSKAMWEWGATHPVLPVGLFEVKGFLVNCHNGWGGQGLGHGCLSTFFFKNLSSKFAWPTTYKKSNKSRKWGKNCKGRAEKFASKK